MPQITRRTTSPLTLEPGSPVPDYRPWEAGAPTPEAMGRMGPTSATLPGRPPDWLSGYPYQTPGATPTPTGPTTATLPGKTSTPSGRPPDWLSGIPYSGASAGVIPDKQMTPWEQWLGAEPRAAYGGWLGGLQGTPALKRYYEGMQNTMYGRYFGELGGQAMAGQAPTQTYPDWLQAYPAQQQYQNLPGWMRGYNPQQHSPRYRWLNY